MVWLRCEKRCQIVLQERSPRSWSCGQPDVLGVSPSRYMIEVEIKRSVSDFRADAKKTSRINRPHHPQKYPKLFYYFAPCDVAAKILPILPDWAGLMDVCADGIRQPRVIKKAPPNPLSEKLTIKEYFRLQSMLTNHLLASETSRDYERSRWRSGNDPFEPYLYPNVPHFEI